MCLSNFFLLIIISVGLLVNQLKLNEDEKSLNLFQLKLILFQVCVHIYIYIVLVNYNIPALHPLK